jgi:hypothetical protein
MRGLWRLDIISIFCLFSPPVLLCIAWARFFELDEVKAQPEWRRKRRLDRTSFGFHIPDDWCA